MKSVQLFLLPYPHGAVGRVPWKTLPETRWTFSLECFFRLSGHASPAQRKPDSNWSCHSRVTALQKRG